jgi:Icc-related predicted phosphoesterase
MRSTKEIRRERAWEIARGWEHVERNASNEAHVRKVMSEILQRNTRQPLRTPTVRAWFQEWLQVKAEETRRRYIAIGNGDFHPLEPLLDELAAKGLCVNLSSKVHREDGLVFCGMNHVRDYPFGYKHWCAQHDDFVTCPVQFCGEGLTLDANGRWIELPNLREYLLAKPSLHDRLDALRLKLTPDEIGRSVWLVHNPPADLGMDTCYDGRQVGSPTITRFIQDTQPLLGCSGHIQESPYQPGGKWAAWIGRTIWFQPGQEGSKLHYVALEVDDDLAIRNARHSIFGLFPA